MMFTVNISIQNYTGALENEIKKETGIKACTEK